MCRAIALLLALMLPGLGWADFLEVRRNANIYQQPDKTSQALDKLRPAASEERLILHLLEDERTNGYYKVRLPEGPGHGWVYKTLVRRYRDSSGPYVRYQRSLYPHWNDVDHDCQNTRAEVLIRDDDDQQVVFRDPQNPCVVASGTWLDPYTGDAFSSARQIQVDHFVPLKNAHESGAWAWSRDKKRQYANFMENEMHLMAVSGRENGRKGAKGPDEYLPPNAAFHCEYVSTWLDIKYEWGLAISDQEAATIQSIQENCTNAPD